MADEERKECLEVLKWINGNDDEVSRISGYPRVDTKWYIVSSKWLNKWKRLKKLEDFTTSEDENEMDIDLGQIDSEDIIDNNPAIKIQNNYILKQGLSNGRDYEILPKKA